MFFFAIAMPSIYCMRQMISICEQYAKEYEIMFNPIKSILLCYNLISDFIPSVKLCGQYIEVVSDEIYLVNHIYKMIYTEKIFMSLLVIFIDGVIILLTILTCVIVLH